MYLRNFSRYVSQIKKYRHISKSFVERYGSQIKKYRHISKSFVERYGSQLKNTDMYLKDF